MVDGGHRTLMQDLGSALDAATVLCFYYLHKPNNMGMDADSVRCINRRFLIICYFSHHPPPSSSVLFFYVSTPSLHFHSCTVFHSCLHTHTLTYTQAQTYPVVLCSYQPDIKLIESHFYVSQVPSTLQSCSTVSYSLFPAEKLLYHRGNLTFWGIGVI